jgi:streptogramin lyase
MFVHAGALRHWKAVIAGVILALLVVAVAQAAGDRTYTLDVDFDEGTLVNLNHDPNHDQLQLNAVTGTFPFIWIAVSSKGTIVRVNTDTGAVLGEYWSAPQNRYHNPSRTTVDLYGNVWSGNRDEADGGQGSVVKIGLITGGTRVNADGSPNPSGDYLAAPYAYNTCVDKNSDGLIKTSRGLGDVRGWPNASGVDHNGGVDTADDECILNYVRTTGNNTRHVSVDQNNNVWVAGHLTNDNAFDLLDGNTGAILATFNVGCGGYGGLVDGNGVLWSSSRAPAGLLRYDTKNTITTADDTWSCIGLNSLDTYGMGIDSAGNIWNVAHQNNQLRKYSPAGVLLGTYNHGDYYAQGLVVDSNDHVWVAHSLYRDSVGHLLNNGTFVGNVTVGSGPTGVAVDNNGKIWATNYYSGTASRIDPLGDGVGGGGAKIGAVDYTTGYLGGNLYNYSDMTGAVAMGSTSPQGTWTVIRNSGTAGNQWTEITWNTEPEGSTPPGTQIIVEARAADTQAGLSSQPWTAISNGVGFSLTGQYIEIRTTLKASTGGASPILSDLILESYHAPVFAIGIPFAPQLASAAFAALFIVPFAFRLRRRRLTS